VGDCLIFVANIADGTSALQEQPRHFGIGIGIGIGIDRTGNVSLSSSVH
jgi:hypothetical protein